MKILIIILLLNLPILGNSGISFASNECLDSFSEFNHFIPKDLPPYIPFSSYFDPKKKDQFYADNPTAQRVIEGTELINNASKSILNDYDHPDRGRVSVLLAMQGAFYFDSNGKKSFASIRDTSAELSYIFKRPIVHFEFWPRFLLATIHDTGGEVFVNVFSFLLENAIERHVNKNEPAIFFDITGVDVDGVKKGITYFEIQTIFKNVKFLQATQFYHNRNAISQIKARELLSEIGWL